MLAARVRRAVIIVVPGVVLTIAWSDGNFFSVVDIFNAKTGTWSTAAISKARIFLVATSLPDQGLAMFAGGTCESCDICCSGCREAWIVGGHGVGDIHAWDQCAALNMF